MKKIFVFSWMIFLISISYGQISSFGIKSGVNISKVKNINIDYGQKFKLDYNINFFLERSLSEKFQVMVALGITDRGDLYSYSADPEDKYTKLNLHYIELPLLLKYRPVSKISIISGLSPKYLFYANNKSKEFNQNYTSFINNKFDIGISVGLGYAITKKLAFEIIYDHGLIPFQKLPNTDIPFQLESKIQRSNYGLLLNLVYDLKKK